jgi:hypothetical protein
MDKLVKAVEQLKMMESSGGGDRDRDSRDKAGERDKDRDKAGVK